MRTKCHENFEKEKNWNANTFPNTTQIIKHANNCWLVNCLGGATTERNIMAQDNTGKGFAVAQALISIQAAICNGYMKSNQELASSKREGCKQFLKFIK